MIYDKRMHFVRSEKGFDYYVFSPSLTRQYYNKQEEWTDHRKRLTHKVRMLFYLLRGGYRILYMMDGGTIASYIVYTRCGKSIIRGSTKKDLFTVFLTTNPDYRKKGLATKIVDMMLNDIGLKYENAYKTILTSNIGSTKAALANGYRVLYPAKKTGILKTISEADSGVWNLYVKSR